MNQDDPLYGHIHVCTPPGLSPLNSLWPSGTIWCWRSGSTLAQVMACCLMATSHYLSQCWLIISEVLQHLPESSLPVSAWTTILCLEFEQYICNITATSHISLLLYFTLLWSSGLGEIIDLYKNPFNFIGDIITKTQEMIISVLLFW